MKVFTHSSSAKACVEVREISESTEQCIELCHIVRTKPCMTHERAVTAWCHLWKAPAKGHWKSMISVTHVFEHWQKFCHLCSRKKKVDALHSSKSLWKWEYSLGQAELMQSKVYQYRVDELGSSKALKRLTVHSIMISLLWHRLVINFCHYQCLLLYWILDIRKLPWPDVTSL